MLHWDGNRPWTAFEISAVFGSFPVIAFQTVRTKALAERSFRAIRNIRLHRLPVTVLVPNLLAQVANGKHALQQIDPFGQLTRLSGGSADEVGKQRQNDDANGRIDERNAGAMWEMPVVCKAKTNQRLDDRQGIRVIRTTEPGRNDHRNDEGNRKDDARPDKIINGKAEDCQADGRHGFL